MEEKNIPEIQGTMNPQPKDNKKMLSKEEIVFEIDEEGKAIPQKVEVEVYDRALDDELFLTTLELDNALTMYDSVRKASKTISVRANKELTKLNTIITDIEKLEKPTDDQKKMLLESKKQLKELENSMKKDSFDTEIKLQAYMDKIKETRKDFKTLEEMRKKAIEVRQIQAVPCTVTESHRYFTKRMWKDKDGKWINPTGEEDTTYISQLLAEKVIEPKLTVNEWDHAKPNMRLSIKEAISEISYYKRPSPKEVLVERRRSEKLKNLIGE